LVFLLISGIFHWNKKITAILIVLFGLLTKGFSELVALIGLIPVVGPLIAKVLSWPLFFTLNGLAYLLTFVAIKAGNKKDVINTKILVTIFLLGVIIGVIIGNLL
jgi:uncharacterized membrane protein